MRTHAKFMLAGLTATILLAAAVSSASANHLSVSEKNGVGRWTVLRFATGEHVVECAITIEGSFHSSTIAKTVGALFGYINRLSIASCTGGSTTVLTSTFPWHLRYRGFRGSLPTITGFSLGVIGMAFSIQPTGNLACLARSTAERPAVSTINVNAGTATGITMEEGAEIPLTGGLFEVCPYAAAGHFTGTSSSFRTPGGTNITVTLI